jgi:hypothetical protein
MAERFQQSDNKGYLDSNIGIYAYHTSCGKIPPLYPLPPPKPIVCSKLAENGGGILVFQYIVFTLEYNLNHLNH